MKRFSGLLIVALWCVTAFGQTDSVRVIRSVKTNTPVIDGLLEAEWWRVPPSNGFTQREPDEGQPATVKTDVRVMHSDNALYVSFRCYEDDPSLIESKLTKRDMLWASDRVDFWLDTYHDHQNAFYFGTNPHGIKDDGTFYNDMDQEDDWDGYWDVATTSDDSGWVAEFKIPYSTLRFKETEGEQVWGFNAFRNIERNKEWAYWQPVTRDKRERVSEFGHLEGLTGLKPGSGLEIRPYAVANFEEEGHTPLQGQNDWENVGLDVKYRLASNLTLDATLNPDFAQIEADNEVINLSDYPVYLDEKRPFFLEGATLFDTRMELFYSRRVANPRGGAKVTGKVGKSEIAFIAAQNQNEDGELENFGVVRLKQNIMDGSYIGLLLTDKESAAEDYARVWSADTRIKLSDPAVVALHVAQSFKPDLQDDNWAYNFGGSYETDIYSGSFWADGRGANFRANDAGFIGYTDYNRVGSWMQWAPRPEKWGIRKIYHNVNGGLEWQLDNRFREIWWNYNNSFQTMNYMYFGGGISHSDVWRRNYIDENEDELEPWSYDDNFGKFNMENYAGWDYWVWFETDDSKKWAFDIGHSQGDFRDGYEREIWGGIQVRPRSNLTLNFGGELDHVEGVSDIEDGAKTDFIVTRFKTEWYLSLKMFTRLNVQYVHEDGSYYTNALFGYEFAPESFFYLVYDDDRSQLLGWETVNDRKIKMKLSYFMQI
ncbi:carbohydrate binding family 9 domain-containing protein [bacterium]|nr:carbohydrate binding family 9 domain-containing protein [bacterium]